jgi:hypothetical protein
MPATNSGLNETSGAAYSFDLTIERAKRQTIRADGASSRGIREDDDAQSSLTVCIESCLIPRQESVVDKRNVILTPQNRES